MEKTDIQYIPINLILFLKEKNHNYDIFIKINDRYIKYAHKEMTEVADLKKLVMQGMEHIYLTEQGYAQYIDSKLALIQSVNQPKDNNITELIDDLADNADLMKDLFKSSGCESSKIELANMVSMDVLKIIESQKDFKDLFTSFKSKSKHDFFRKTFICVISAYMFKLQDTIDQKMIQSYCCGVLLSDIYLSESDISKSYTTYENIYMNKEILLHSEKVINKLPGDPILGSTIFSTIVRSHHEKPDGTGYPNRLMYTRFDLFLATYFIAELYYTLMHANNFMLDNHDAILILINKECNKYRTPFFKKAISNFNKAFNYEGVVDE